MELLRDVHTGLSTPPNCDTVTVCTGYDYYHYRCDGQDDRGWGCGYRTLQTMCSWLANKMQSCDPVPTIPKIQETLVTIGDKDRNFINSKEWIGSVEVGMVLDKIYDVPCKILHISSGSQFPSHVQEIQKHFLTNKSIIMMGGESDTSSKGILGLATSAQYSCTYLLVLDPHYYELSAHGGREKTTTIDVLQKNGWVEWRDINSLHQDTFYNLCLPQTKHLI